MKKILLAFQFLTIIPIRDVGGVSEKEMGGASAFFPLIGAFQGALFTLSAILFLKIFPIELTNGFLVLVIAILSGGLHLDGLADTFDAIALRGNKERKLAVMKESTVGSIGVIAIVLVILLKYLLLNTLFLNSSLIIYYSSLFLMPIFARWVMVPTIFHSKSARNQGIGKMFIENTKLKEMMIATVLVICWWLLIAGFFSSSFVFLILLMLPLLYIFGLLSARVFNKKFGGMTGDTFGAVSEISEILFLLVIICSQSFI
jgi:adenosylcobinamide-GDP ribazoletransferase